MLCQDCVFRKFLPLGSFELRPNRLFAWPLGGRRLSLGGGRLRIRRIWFGDETMVEEALAACLIISGDTP